MGEKGIFYKLALKHILCFISHRIKRGLTYEAEKEKIHSPAVITHTVEHIIVHHILQLLLSCIISINF
jgi:hypothetical protein